MSSYKKGGFRLSLPLSCFLILVLFSLPILGQEDAQKPEEKLAPKPSPMNELPPEKKSSGPSQSELREKYKNQIGGFGFERYYSIQAARMLDSQWAIGATGYMNREVNRFDNDVAFSYFLTPPTFYGRLRNAEEKYWGGAVFLQRYIVDSPFFASLWLGRENFRKTESALYWESAGNTYRYEKDSFSSGPRNFAGLGLGFRYQTVSGFFFGWEAVWSWYFPYKNSFSVSDLYYSDRVASTGDLLYRKYAYQNSEKLPGTSFGLNLFVGWAF
ncbi:hypothetical protein EHQ27_03435 [Leptospira wolffii]|uniref:hypothetical protein n=1 Tax=Leptospira wolffii TaxID=409998 RepID=UPI001082491E|nr:hypothetical protein [Leptospira wolffii]TGK61572.1 hypothetical protein EHQ32_01570 [Leptospira wolffii]TGK70116.1 hypothetical protein EHQ35_16985 [Leptospira wolffii]TGK77039.1 hypothetical protein EHQ27_03435 [Leptospira wolffii]TGL31109.1 hypothetical protein EHQ57_06825 [Leptospira wolffii]